MSQYTIWYISFVNRFKKRQGKEFVIKMDAMKNSQQTKLIEQIMCVV